MLKISVALFFWCCCIVFLAPAQDISCIRINQSGYTSGGIKVAVLGSVKPVRATTFSVEDEKNRVVFTSSISRDFGKYGPFSNTYRLDF